MARDGRVLTKAEWIEELGKRIDQYSSFSRAQRWLESQLAHFTPGVPDDKRLTDDVLVDIIHRQARLYVAERDFGRNHNVMYTEYLSPYGSTANMAWEFALQLVEICRHIGGDDIADAVAVVVLADRSAIWRYTLDFLADVFTPLYPRILDALQRPDEEQRFPYNITFRLGKVMVTATPLSSGRALLWIGREYVEDGKRQKVGISLSGGDFKPDGSGLGLNGAYGPSLAAVLQTLELATRAFNKLDDAGRDALFAKYRVLASAQ